MLNLVARCHASDEGIQLLNSMAAATKLLHAVSANCKLLTIQGEPRSSLQSIIGATDIFLLRVNGMHSIHESYFR